MPATPPRPRAEARPPEIVVDDTRPLVLPDEFLAYVEILRAADPDAHNSLSRELALAEEGPAAVEAAAHRRRAMMLASLQSALTGAQTGPRDVVELD